MPLELISRIHDWRRERNRLIHALLGQKTTTEDFKQAAEEGYELVKQFDNKVACLNRYFDKEAELKGYVRANMTTLYANVLAAQTGYEAAKAGFDAARLNKAAVDTQYKQGQISKAQYLGASIEYVQKEAALRSAVDSYEQAVLTYEAALRGTVDAK